MPRSRFSLFFVSLFTLGVLAFLWLPVARLYATSRVLDASRIGAVFLSPLARALFLNTLFLSASTAALSILVATPVALAASRGAKFLRAPILLLCALPLALPPTLMASAYLEYSRTPPARSVASLAAEHALSINAIFVAAPVLALCFFPLVAFAMWAALQTFPSEWEDAARLFGNGWNAWTRVLAPLLMPATLGASGVVAALSMWEMGAPDLLDAKTYSVQIYRAFSAGGDNNDAARAAIPMLFLGALCFAPAWRALRFYDGWKFDAAGRPRHALPRQMRFVLLLTIVVLCLSPLAPLGIFVAQARPPRVFLEVWDANRDDIFNTLVAPTLAATLVTMVSLGLVVAWREYSLRVQRLVLSFSLAPLLFAPVLLAVALIGIYNVPLFDVVSNSRYGWLVIGLVARFLPIGVLWLYEATRQVSQAFDEAAQNAGASKFFIARTVFVPLLLPSCLALLAVLWALCAGELSLSVLLNAPGGQTLPVPIFNQMHIGATENVAALSLTLAAMSGGVLLMLLGLWAKLRKLN